MYSKRPKYDYEQYNNNKHTKDNFFSKILSKIINVFENRWPRMTIFFFAIISIMSISYIGSPCLEPRDIWPDGHRHYKIKYDGKYQISDPIWGPQTYKEAKRRIKNICIWYVLILLLFYKEIRNFFLYKVYYPDRGILPKENSKPKKLSGKIDTKNFKS